MQKDIKEMCLNELFTKIVNLSKTNNGQLKYIILITRVLRNLKIYIHTNTITLKILRANYIEQNKPRKTGCSK